VVGASLYASPIDLRSLLEESNFPLIIALISSASTSANTTRKTVDLTDTDIKDLLFVLKQG
jgi:hypothetical protein